MDPPHVTEFASSRYFEKLNQRESHSVPASTSSSFKLPLRKSVQRVERNRRFQFSGLLLSKKAPEVHESSSRLPESRPKSSSRSLQTLFLSLPNELQVQVLSSLLLADLLNLRLASRSWHAVVSLHDSPLVRYHLDHHIPAFASRLYPPSPSSMNLKYLAALWHRVSIASTFAHLMSDWIANDIFLRKSASERCQFATQHERMRTRLVPVLFTIFHFFETYHKLHLEFIREHDGHGLYHKPYTVNPVEARIMSQYDDRTLLYVHEVFPVMIAAICRRLRPPSYAGRLERSIRGYIREQTPEECQVALLCIGGLRKVVEFWQIKSYNTRLSAVVQWHSTLMDQLSDTRPKPYQSLKNLMKGKPFVPGEPATSDSSIASQSVSESIDTHSGISFASFANTGKPMSSVSKEDLRVLMEDMPPLQELWVKTAEALLLDRDVVGRVTDIRRNGQVMLRLIQEQEL